MFTIAVRRTLLGLTLLAIPATAHAQGSIELGGFGTYPQFDKTMPLDDRVGGGARLSIVSGSGWTTFMLEGEGAYVSSPVAGLDWTYIPARARLLYGLPLGSMANLLLGGGGVRNQYSDGTNSDSEWGYTALAGFRLHLGSFMVLRLDANVDYVANPIEWTTGVTRTTTRSASAGLSFPLWRQKVEKPTEIEVERPTPAPQQIVVAAAPQPQQPTTSGPDADRDGVADSHDACSGTPAGATVDRDGCQVYRDTDGDGIIDPRDACPATTAGELVDGRGCAAPKDADRDGVNDANDRCPNTAAGVSVDASGCTVSGPVARPDPDSDGDTVPDSKDKCPASAPGARVDVTGCAILFKAEERTVTLRGVTFGTWSDELTPGSMQILDDVAQQLVAAPSVKVEVAGHTDSGGARSRNIRLSLARAEAVRAYLIMKGVAPERLVARGYGPDQPVATNATVAGRAQNRRVELRRID